MVNQVLLLETERGPDQSLLVPERPPETLELEKVSFSYPDSPIRQLNVPALKLKSGDRVMLLGAVGCGKSTLLKVLAGLYKPGSGRVRLGDADLWEIDPQVVSTHLSYLPQTVHLFKGTLSSNLALSGAVSDSRMIHVAKVLRIDAIAADSPQGMEREISEGGEGLSVGQRQLVGLGRVFVAKPRIWLLDEPTAALDRESEQAVLQALEAELEPEDILVFSTHRPNLVSNLATRIVFMERGEILLDGRPEEVISRLTAKPKRQASPDPEAPQDSEPPQTSRPKVGPGTDDFF
jgi:ATP-binding cassette subfamily C protein LapB